MCIRDSVYSGHLLKERVPLFHGRRSIPEQSRSGKFREKHLPVVAIETQTHVPVDRKGLEQTNNYVFTVFLLK